MADFSEIKIDSKRRMDKTTLYKYGRSYQNLFGFYILSIIA